MLLAFEVGLFIYGLVALIRGKYAVRSGNELRGGWARVCGALCMAPITLTLIFAFTLGVILGLQGYSPEDIQSDFSGMITGIEVLLLIIGFISANVLANKKYKKQEEQAVVSAEVFE